MAFLKLNLSNSGRKILSLIFTVTSIITALISLVLIVYGLYITAYIAPHLPSEKAVITLIFTVITMHGMELLTYYSVGLGVCQKCYKQAYKKHSRYLLRIWIFTGYSSVINIVVIGTMAAAISNHIIRSMHHSMERGMALYLIDPNWKVVIDSLQVNKQCCGAFSYEDWYRISWINSHMLNWSSEHTKKYTVYGDHVFVPVTPWSCCRMDYPTQCFHDPIQQKKATLMFEEPDNLQLKTIHHTGCIEVLRVPLENGFLIFILSSYIILFLQTVMTMMSRILFFSYRNAVILGDPLGLAPGWVFGSASDIFQDTSKQKIEPSLAYQDNSLIETAEEKSYRTNRTRGTDENSTLKEELVKMTDYSSDRYAPQVDELRSYKKRRLKAGNQNYEKTRESIMINRNKRTENSRSREQFVDNSNSILNNVITKSNHHLYEEIKKDEMFLDEYEESEESLLCPDIESRLFLKYFDSID